MNRLGKQSIVHVVAICYSFLCPHIFAEEKHMLDWEALSNPIYAREGWSVKDACMISDGKTFYAFFSAFYWDRGKERSHVVGVETRDFITFSEPLFTWDGEEDGWTGMCSPNVSKIGDKYVLTYNSWGDVHQNGRKNQLFYATSEDLRTWDKHKPLAADLTKGKRCIDAAIAYAGDKYCLVWKQGQTPQMAYGDALDGEWIKLGTPTGGWFENAQFLRIDGTWVRLVTGRGHLPYISRMKGSGEQPKDWLEWDSARCLQIAQEKFNTDNKANAAFLADLREYDGYFYLLYAGRTEGKTHAGRGNNKLGLSRSRDLVSWSVPGAPSTDETSLKASNHGRQKPERDSSPPPAR